MDHTVAPCSETWATPGTAAPVVDGEAGAGPIGWALSLSLLVAVFANVDRAWPLEGHVRLPTRALLALALLAWAAVLLDALRAPTAGGARSGPWARFVRTRPRSATGALLLGSILLTTIDQGQSLDRARSEPALPALLVVMAFVALQIHHVPRESTSRPLLRAVVTVAPWSLVLIGAGAVATIDAPALGWPPVVIGVLVATTVAATAAPKPLALRRSPPTAAPDRGHPFARARTAIVVAAGVGLLLLFLVGVTRQIDTHNLLAANGHDQDAYLNYAEALRERPDAVALSRLQMPLYPYLLSLAPAGGRNADGFEAGLRISIAIGVAGLAVLGLWAWKVAGGAAAAFLVVSVVGLSMFLFLASWILADVLAALLFTAWLGLCWRLLAQPSALLGAGVGLLGGLAHLTKPVVLAPLAVLVVLCLVAGVWKRWTPATARPASYLAAGASALLLFGSTVAPYAVNSERVYGSPTYNVATDHYAWYDDWAQAVEGRVTSDDQLHVPMLPSQDVPSAGRYLREHGADDVVDRLLGGWGAQWEITLTGRLWEGYFGYGWTVTLLLGATLASLAVAGARARARLRRERLVTIFLTTTLVALAAATAWWFPIGSGNRYLLPVWLPGVLLCVWVIHRALSPWSVSLAGRVLRADTAVFATLAVPVAAISIWNALVLSASTAGGY